MINEEVTKEVMQELENLATYMMNIAKEQAGNTRQLSEFLREKIKSAYQNADNPLFNKNNREMKLKDLYKQGQLEQVNIRKGEIKNIRKELNRYGVKFSVMKDKANGDFVVFFQAKDTKMIDLAFRQVFLKAKTTRNRQRYEGKTSKQREAFGKVGVIWQKDECLQDPLCGVIFF